MSVCRKLLGDCGGGGSGGGGGGITIDCVSVSVDTAWSGLGWCHPHHPPYIMCYITYSYHFTLTRDKLYIVRIIH